MQQQILNSRPLDNVREARSDSSLAYSARFLAQDALILDACQKITQHLPPAPLEFNHSRVLLCGGFVRDVILGVKPADVDIEVFGVNAKQLNSILNELFPGRVKMHSKDFAVFDLELTAEIKLQIKTCRRYSTNGDSFEDPSMTLEQAASDKDFNINSLSVDPSNGRLFDPLNAIMDVQSRILRAIHPDNFLLDPRLYLRAVQLTARLELSTDALDALLAQAGKSETLRNCPVDMVRDQFSKLLLFAERPSIGFELMRRTGFLASRFPELQALVGAMQDQFWHPEGGTWTHTMMVLDAGAIIIRRAAHLFNDKEKLLIMLSCLEHDLGKPNTVELSEQGRITHFGHESEGAIIAAKLTRRMGFSEEIATFVQSFTSEHMRPQRIYKSFHKKYARLEEAPEITDACISQDKNFQVLIKRLLNDLPKDSWRVFLALTEADFRGRDTLESKGEIYRAGALIALTIREHKLDLPLITEDDLSKLGFDIYTNGSGAEKIMTALVTEILNKVDEKQRKGILLGKNRALTWVAHNYFVTRAELTELGVHEGSKRGEVMRALKDKIDCGKIKSRKEALKFVGSLVAGK